jgi:hypothetical protein
MRIQKIMMLLAICAGMQVVHGAAAGRGGASGAAGSASPSDELRDYWTECDEWGDLYYADDAFSQSASPDGFEGNNPQEAIQSFVGPCLVEGCDKPRSPEDFTPEFCAYYYDLMENIDSYEVSERTFELFKRCEKNPHILRMLVFTRQKEAMEDGSFNENTNYALLFAAAVHGAFGSADILVEEFGANFSAVNQEGDTVLHEALIQFGSECRDIYLHSVEDAKDCERMLKIALDRVENTVAMLKKYSKLHACLPMINNSGKKTPIELLDEGIERFYKGVCVFAKTVNAAPFIPRLTAIKVDLAKEWDVMCGVPEHK